LENPFRELGLLSTSLLLSERFDDLDMSLMARQASIHRMMARSAPSACGSKQRTRHMVSCTSVSIQTLS